ncbi:kinase-like protein, partial [Fistulina hepatica ATCC 64428]
LFFAQDEKGRHVAIKLVKKDSDEYKIAQILLEKGDAAVNHCVIPILEIIDCEEHAFMVMPRWDEVGLTQWLRTLANVLDYVHCLLKGLAFLHEHCIIHRDLKVDNILCNHFGIHCWEHNWLRNELMKQRRLIFAISDFNMSLLLPPSSRPRCFRLPTCRSWESYVDRAYDVRQGELDYDPFLLDVGNLGVVFARYLRGCTSLAPILAPLIDSMVTDDLSRRFTASEALQFFEATVDSVPRENLDVRVRFQPSTGGPFEDVVYLDRWVGLSPEFIVKWSAYRLQKPTLSLRFLRWFCDLDDRAFFAVQSVRFFLRGHFTAAFLRAGHALTLAENWFRPEDEL